MGTQDPVISIPVDVLHPMDSLEATIASTSNDSPHQKYHDHEETGCVRVSLDVYDLVALLEHHYEAYLADLWTFFVYGSASGATRTRANEILQLLLKLPASCLDGEEPEAFVKQIFKDIDDNFFKDKNPLWVKVFKGEATFHEAVKAYRQKMEQNEQSRAQSKGYSAAYAAVVTDRFAQFGRFVKDGERAVFEHRDGRVIEVTKYAMQESHSLRGWPNPTPAQEQEEREQRDKQRAVYQAHKGSPFEALMVEVLGDNASTIGALKAIAALAAAAMPKDSPSSLWRRGSGVFN